MRDKPCGKEIGGAVVRTLTQERVRALFNYQPSTGVLYWRERPLVDFPDKRAWKIWNTRWAGRPAGTVRSSDSGNNSVTIDKTKFLIHRVIWLYVHGEWPDEEIDHINGDGRDNRLVNLREVTSQENQMNLSIYASNTSGVMGVSYCPDRGKWLASIRNGTKQINLGRFESLEDAILARRSAAKALGFHPNHGRAK